MSNSDYLIKATMKKISERLNKTLLEKFEEAANVAQEAPELLKKELENLKDEIIEEAKHLEENDIDNRKNSSNKSKSSIEKSLEEINQIKLDLDNLNDLLNK